MEKFKEMFESEPKDVWKNGGQQVMTIGKDSILYRVSGKSLFFKCPDGQQFEIPFNRKKQDPEKVITSWYKAYKD